MFCLLALPGQAWEINFENSDWETSHHVFPYGTFSVGSPTVFSCLAHTNVFRCTTNESNTGLEVYFDDYIAFSGDVYLTNGIYLCLGNSTYKGSPVSLALSDSRIELALTPAGDYVNIYSNGAYKGQLLVHGPFTSVFIYGISRDFEIDDVTNQPATLGFADSFVAVPGAVSTLYYTYGFAVSSGTNRSIVLYDPDGEVVDTFETTYSLGWNSVNAVLIPGVYTYRVYSEDSMTGKPLYLYAKSFEVSYTVDNPGGVAYSLEIESDMYSPGDRVKVFSYVSDPGSGACVNFYCDAELMKSIGVVYESQNSYYKIPYDTPSSDWLVELADGYGDVKAQEGFSVYGASVGGASIRFDKPSYTADEDVGLFYESLPPDSTIYLHGKTSVNGDSVFTKKWTGKSGSGTLVYSPVSEGSLFYYVNVYDDELLICHATAEVVGGESILYGYVSDAFSSVYLSGVNVTIEMPGEDLTLFAITDSSGRYEFRGLPWGYYEFYVNHSGYQVYENIGDVIDSSTFRDDVRLMPLSSGGGPAIYGMVLDSEGDPLGGVVVEAKSVSDPSVVYTALTGFNGGYDFSDHDFVNGTQWILLGSKDGYYSDSLTVTISGTTLTGLTLVSVTSGDITPPGNIPNNGYTIGPDGKILHDGHPVDIDHDGSVSNEEWRVFVETFAMFLMMLFLMLIFLGTFRRR